MAKRKVRVLVACALGNVNDVVTLDDADIKTHAHEVDDNAEAVKYAEALKAPAAEG